MWLLHVCNRIIIDFLFSHILYLVIEEIAYHAHMYAELDKRVESNFSDIIKALEDHRIQFKDILEYYNNVDDVSIVRGTFISILN